MAVLTSFTNATSGPDAMDTLNGQITRVAALEAGAASIPQAVIDTQTARDQAVAASSAPALAIQKDPATPTVPPAGVASGSQYWAAITDGIQLYLNTSGTGAPVSPAIIQYGKGFVDNLGVRTSTPRLYRNQAGEVVELTRSFNTPALDMEIGTATDGRVFIPGLVPEGATLAKILSAAAAAQTAAVNNALATVTPVGAFDAIRSSAYRPIDTFTLGNSKTLLNGNGGWHYALSVGLIARTGIWATPYYPILVAQTSLGNQGGPGGAANNASGGTAVLPAGYDNFVYPNSTAFYLASGAQTGPNNKRVSIPTTGSLNVNSQLRYTLSMGGFAAGSGGSVKPGVRDGANATLATAGPVATDSGAGTQTLYQSLVLPAATRNTSLQFGPYINSNPETGPVLYFGHRVDDMLKVGGVSMNVLLPLSGNSLRDIATVLAGIPDAQLIQYFSQFRFMQQQRGLKPRIVIIGQEGMNSRNDSSGSVGPIGGLPGNTGPGYVDNAKALYNRIRYIWDLKGWDKDELTFLWIIDEFSKASEPELLAFEASMREWVSSARGMDLLAMNNVITWPEMVALNFTSSGDNVHKPNTGFYAEAYTNRVPKLIYGEGYR